MKDSLVGILLVLVVVVCLGGLVTVGMIGCPRYNVYERGMAGEAELAQAEANRKVKTVEAEASKQSAVFLAEAEVIRAEGVAKANKIIGDSLKDNDAYLHYLWVNKLDQGESTIVYVPTEANFPIMEAGRFSKKVRPATPATK